MENVNADKQTSLSSIPAMLFRLTSFTWVFRHRNHRQWLLYISVFIVISVFINVFIVISVFINVFIVMSVFSSVLWSSMCGDLKPLHHWRPTSPPLLSGLLCSEDQARSISVGPRRLPLWSSADFKIIRIFEDTLCSTLADRSWDWLTWGFVLRISASAMMSFREAEAKASSSSGSNLCSWWPLPSRYPGDQIRDFLVNFHSLTFAF